MTQDAMARVRAEEDRFCVTCGKKGGSCKWMDDPIVCMRQQLIDLRVIAEARPERGSAGAKAILQAIYDDHMANVEGGTRLSLHALAYVTGALASAEKPERGSAGERRFRLTDGGRNGVGIREIYSDSPDPNDRPDLWFATARHFDVAREIVAALGGVMVERGARE